MNKNTVKLMEELQNCSDFRRFYNENSDNIAKRQLSEFLNELFEKKGLKKCDVIKSSSLSEVYTYQILSGIRMPERKKLLSLLISIGFDIEEIQLVLKCCEYAPLYAKNESDCVIIYGICQKLPLSKINEMMFEYGFETLG